MLSYSLIYDDASFDSIYHILCKFIFITIATIKILIFARYFPSNRRHQTAPYLYHKNSNILIYNINQLGIRNLPLAFCHLPFAICHFFIYLHYEL